MAHQEQFDLLKQGVEVWNHWRQEHSEMRPTLREVDLRGADLREVNFKEVDLREADLREADLREANLSGANLSRVSFNRADLREADLSHANLSHADFSRTGLSGVDLDQADLSIAYIKAFSFGANLSQANLSHADLSYANLSQANLNRANLSQANLSEVDLRGANLSNALAWRTVFVNVDLSRVKGLDAMEHQGPSEISVSTIYRSHGNVPEDFLRGAGVPNSFIDYMHSLVTFPIDYYSCFISYSSKDEDFAKRLYADLQSNGVRCWFAPEDLKIGDTFWDRIDQSIRLYDRLLLVLSQHSVESSWVEREVAAALEREQQQKRTVLFPVRLDDTIQITHKAWVADIRRRRHIGNFTAWKHHDAYQKALNRLLRDLEAEPQQMGLRDGEQLS